MAVYINSVPNDKFLALSKLKAFADDKSYVAKMMISVSSCVEDIVEKGKNAGYQHFLLLPQCFQKVSPIESLKIGIVRSRVKRIGVKGHATRDSPVKKNSCQ